MTKKNEPRKNTRPMIKDVDRNGKMFERPDNRKTTADFIADACRVWGESYDYSPTVYLGGKQPVLIRCPKHDYTFRVPMAQNHIMRHNATGYPICAAEKRHGREYGPDWREYLKPSKKNSYVGLIHHKSSKPKKSPEQIAAEQRIKEERRRQREAAEQALIDRYQAKNINEARFIEKMITRYGDIYGRKLLDYQGRETKVTLVCPKHGPFRITPRTLLTETSGRTPHGCWKCAGLEDPDDRPAPMTADGFFQRMHQLYDATELDFTTSVYRGRKNSVTAYCRKHGAITHPASYWLDGKGCEYCTWKKVYYPLWKEYARQVHGDKYEYVGQAPTTGTELIHYICKEHGLIEQRFDVHVSQGCGCPKCSNYPNKKSPEQRCQEWIEKSDEKFRGEFDYSEAPADYVNNDSKVWLTHKPCGTRFQVTPDAHLRGVNGGCPVCNAIFLESGGERTVRLWLEDHHIDHDLQHELPNEDPTLPLQYLKTDFWIDDFDGQPLVIEYNGELHYEDVGHFYRDRVRNFEVQQHRDRYLRQYCADHHLRLLEIPYWEFDHIDAILTSVLIDGNDIPTFEPPADKT